VLAQYIITSSLTEFSLLRHIYVFPFPNPSLLYTFVTLHHFTIVRALYFPFIVLTYLQYDIKHE